MSHQHVNKGTKIFIDHMLSYPLESTHLLQPEQRVYNIFNILHNTKQNLGNGYISINQ